MHAPAPHQPGEFEAANRRRRLIRLGAAGIVAAIVVAGAAFFVLRDDDCYAWERWVSEGKSLVHSGSIEEMYAHTREGQKLAEKTGCNELAQAFRHARESTPPERMEAMRSVVAAYSTCPCLADQF